MNWIFVLLLLWLSSFTPSERVALGSAFLVLVGVIGEEVAELKVFEEERKARTRNVVKRFAIGLLVLGLAGDLIGVVIGQAEMKALTKEAGDAAISARNAATSAGEAKQKSDAAKGEADAVEEQTGELTGRLENASGKMSELEGQIRVQGPRWRLLEANRAAFIESLRPFAKQRVTVVKCGEWGKVEPEEFKLAQELLNFLGNDGAGWSMGAPGYTSWARCGAGGATAVGGNLITLSSKADKEERESAQALADALNGIGISTVIAPIDPQWVPQLMGSLGEDSPQALTVKDPKAVILLIGSNPMFDLAGWKTRKK